MENPGILSSWSKSENRALNGRFVGVVTPRMAMVCVTHRGSALGFEVGESV
jgi:hypothetical protein